MPIRTVVVLHTMNPDSFIQLVGRAGRWGQDKTGSVIFYGKGAKQKAEIWNPIPPLVSDPVQLPCNLLSTLMLAGGLNCHRKTHLKKWCQMEIPQWGWSPQTSTNAFNVALSHLHQLNLLKANQVTNGGRAAVALAEEGDVAILVGVACAKFKKQLENSIQSVQDFLFMFSHFVAEWRQIHPEGTRLDNPSAKVSHLIRSAMVDIQREWSLCKPLLPHFNPTATDHISSLYVDLHSNNSEADSYVFHFLQKVKVFTAQFELPFALAAIAFLEDHLEK